MLDLNSRELSLIIDMFVCSNGPLTLGERNVYNKLKQELKEVLELENVQKEIKELSPIKVEEFPIIVSTRIYGWYVLVDNQWIPQRDGNLQKSKKFNSVQEAIAYQTKQGHNVRIINDNYSYLSLQNWYEPR